MENQSQPAPLSSLQSSELETESFGKHPLGSSGFSAGMGSNPVPPPPLNLGGGAAGQPSNSGMDMGWIGNIVKQLSSLPSEKKTAEGSGAEGMSVQKNSPLGLASLKSEPISLRPNGFIYNGGGSCVSCGPNLDEWNIPLIEAFKNMDAHQKLAKKSYGNLDSLFVHFPNIERQVVSNKPLYSVHGEFFAKTDQVVSLLLLMPAEDIAYLKESPDSDLSLDEIIGSMESFMMEMEDDFYSLYFNIDGADLSSPPDNVDGEFIDLESKSYYLEEVNSLRDEILLARVELSDLKADLILPPYAPNFPDHPFEESDALEQDALGGLVDGFEGRVTRMIKENLAEVHGDAYHLLAAIAASNFQLNDLVSFLFPGEINELDPGFLSLDWLQAELDTKGLNSDGVRVAFNAAWDSMDWLDILTIHYQGLDASADYGYNRISSQVQSQLTAATNLITSLGIGPFSKEAVALYGLSEDLAGQIYLFLMENGINPMDKLYDFKTSNEGVINGTSGTDIIIGGDGDNVIKGKGGADLIIGGGGNDKIYGNGGKDWLFGGGGNDLIEGGSDKDVLLGGYGNDTLDGGSNDDQLSGSYGDDTLTGNGGKDTMVGHHGADSISDLSSNDILGFEAKMDLLIPDLSWNEVLNTYLDSNPSELNDSRKSVIVNYLNGINLRVIAASALLDQYHTLDGAMEVETSQNVIDSANMLLRDFTGLKLELEGIPSVSNSLPSSIVNDLNLQITNLETAKSEIQTHSSLPATDHQNELPGQMFNLAEPQVVVVENNNLKHNSIADHQHTLQEAILVKLHSQYDYALRMLALVAGGENSAISIVGILPGGQVHAHRYLLLEQEGYDVLGTRLEDNAITQNEIATSFNSAWSNLAEEDYTNYQAYLDQERTRISFSNPFSGLYQKVHDGVDHLIEGAENLGKRIGEDIFHELLSKAGDRGEEVKQWLGEGEEVFSEIYHDPGAFLNHLLDSVRLGFSNFGQHFGTHVKDGLFAWLTGNLDGTLELPEKWDAKGTFGLISQVSGVSYDGGGANAIRPKLVERLDKHFPDGEKVMEWSEFSFGVIQTLITDGIGGLWEQLKSNAEALVTGAIDGFISAIETWVINNLIVKGAEALLAAFSPVSALFEVIKELYELVCWLIDEAQRIFALINAVFQSIEDIAHGNIENAAQWIEMALSNSIPVIMDLLADLLGLHVQDSVKNAITGIQTQVGKAIDNVLDWAEDKIVAWVGTVDDGEEPLANPAETDLNTLLNKKIYFSSSDGEFSLFVQNSNASYEVMYEKEGGVQTRNSQVLSAITRIANLNASSSRLDAKSKAELQNSLSKAQVSLNGAQAAITNLVNAKSGIANNPTPSDFKQLIAKNKLEKASIHKLGQNMKELEHFEDYWVVANPSLALPDSALSFQTKPTVQFTTKVNKKAYKVDASVLTRNDDPSNPSSGVGGALVAGWDEHIIGVLKAPNKYARMHILNNKTGGPGALENLTIGTQGNNQRMEKKIEKPLKDAIQADSVMWFKGKVVYRNSSPMFKDFAKRIEIEFGHLDKNLKPIDAIESYHVAISEPQTGKANIYTLNTVARNRIEGMIQSFEPSISGIKRKQLAEVFLRIRETHGGYKDEADMDTKIRSWGLNSKAYTLSRVSFSPNVIAGKDRPEYAADLIEVMDKALQGSFILEK